MRRLLCIASCLLLPACAAYAPMQNGRSLVKGRTQMSLGLQAARQSIERNSLNENTGYTYAYTDYDYGSSSLSRIGYAMRMGLPQSWDLELSAWEIGRLSIRKQWLGHGNPNAWALASVLALGYGSRESIHGELGFELGSPQPEISGFSLGARLGHAQGPNPAELAKRNLDYSGLATRFPSQGSYADFNLGWNFKTTDDDRYELQGFGRLFFASEQSYYLYPGYKYYERFQPIWGLSFIWHYGVKKPGQAQSYVINEDGGLRPLPSSPIQGTAAEHARLAGELARGQMWTDAVSEWGAALALEPGQSDYAQGLAYSLLQKGDTAAALKYYELALEKNPNDASLKAAITRLRGSLENAKPSTWPGAPR